MILLYNTLYKKKEIFIPLDPNHVRMYVCGPTVYNKPHIGNIRSYVVFDVLYRLLKRCFPHVSYIRNITDVDDKIIEFSKRNRITINEVTEKTSDLFWINTMYINNIPPVIEPKATCHILHMIKFIEELITMGHAYEIESCVFFDISSLENYGTLSGQDLSSIKPGYRVEIDALKRDPKDFILWKSSSKDYGWYSPWGWGRPGWHIECSAMSDEYLGTSFDIHGGGCDLVFPHHENEISQSTGVNGPDSFANFWVHSGILTVNGQKMSKSLNNFITLDDLVCDVSWRELRYAFLSTHYRSNLDWTNSIITQSQSALNSLNKSLIDVNFFNISSYNLTSDLMDEDFERYLRNDLNTPMALYRLHRISRLVEISTSEEERLEYAIKLLNGGHLIGIFDEGHIEHLMLKDSFHTNKKALNISSSEIESMISTRNVLRSEKKFQLADSIREELRLKGVLLEDTNDGTLWRSSDIPE
jgi:cysteinyl-tRNA synthetase